MDQSQQAIESLIPVGPESFDIPSESIPSDDQYFLLHFIMGTFFGPDLRGERQQKPVLQRLAEGLPSYTYEKLSGSHIRTVELERIYYYVLRKADPSVVVKLPWLHQYFHGTLPIQTKSSTAAYPQFPDLFSPRFHPHSWFQDGNKIIENIVFINNPDVYYIRSRDIKRFKRLTGLQDLNLDRDGARLHTSVDGEILYSVAVQEVDSNGGFPRSPPSPSGENNSKKTRLLSEFTEADENGSQNGHILEPVSNLPYNGLPYNDAENLGQGMVFLPSQPTLEDWENIVSAIRGGSALTGTATKGRFGPTIGLVDIGECEDSYLFRVSLPGVKRDEREFNCEVENDGKVVIKGVTTAGERSVNRYSQVFEMQTQNLSPPGHFSISFKLPGPVDPQQFTGNFGTDGILEGIVMKDIKMALMG